MKKQIKGKWVAIVVTDGFEQDELVRPREALDKAGAKTEIDLCSSCMPMGLFSS
jgi:protease I